MRNYSRLMKRMKRFGRQEDGAMTIEACLWLPLFFFMFVGIADVALIFHGQARVLRIVQNENRLFSIGRHGSELATQEAILARLSTISTEASVVTQESGGLITSTVTIPTADLDVAGVIGPLASLNMTITSQHILEY